MSKNVKKLIFISMLLFVVISFALLTKSFIFTETSQSEKEQTTSISQTLVPVGWYIHTLNNNVILTRVSKTPDVKATEIYAYGDYILISNGKFDETFENLEEWNNTRWVFEDEVLVKNWEKTKIEEHNALRAEHKAAGADGEHLTYFIFLDDQFVSISLYSQSITTYISEFEQFVRDYVRSLSD